MNAVAFLFPGQGSQYPGMGRDLLSLGTEARSAVSEAQAVTGLPVADLMTRAEAGTIADPHIAQVLVFVASRVLHAQLTARGWQPDVLAGHSLGEYSALAAAGVLDWTEALELVAARGRAMAAAAGQADGTMAAVVGLSADQVAGLCATAAEPDEVLVLANLNSPRQVVVSGSRAAVDALVEHARRAGALRARRLAVGGAYHSPLMAGAQRELETRLRRAVLRPPAVPLVSSVTGALVADLEAYRATLLAQITQPVRWQRTIATLSNLGVGAFVEAGPGRVLTGLGREMVRGARHLAAADALRSGADPRAAVN